MDKYYPPPVHLPSNFFEMDKLRDTSVYYDFATHEFDFRRKKHYIFKKIPKESDVVRVVNHHKPDNGHVIVEILPNFVFSLYYQNGKFMIAHEMSHLGRYYEVYEEPNLNGGYHFIWQLMVDLVKNRLEVMDKEKYILLGNI